MSRSLAGASPREVVGALHNMSVPPRSVITARPATLRGQYVAIAVSPQWDSRWRRAARKGEQEVEDLLLASLGDQANGGWSRGRSARRSGSERLARCTARVLADAGVPVRVGVFIPCSQTNGRPGVVAASHIVSVALLLHRSGPLFLPWRAPEPSLFEPWCGVLWFPEEDA